MASEHPEPPDLSQVPNFHALAEWFSRLRAWSIAAHERVKELEDEAKGKDEQIENLEKDLAEQKHTDDEVEAIIEMATDVHRGVRDFSELLDHLGVHT